MNPERNRIINTFEQSTITAMNKWQVPGMAVAIVEKDQLIYAKGFGVKTLGHKNAVREKTTFQTGSVSKTFTATLMAMLVEEGQIRWEDKVISHLPSFRLYDSEVTKLLAVEDLLSQRSGLPPHAGHLLPHLGFDRPYIIKSLRYIKPTAGYQTEYSYQNSLFNVAGALIEKVTGQSLEKNLTERIFNPLGMTDSTATLAGYINSKNKAQGHYYLEPKIPSPIKSIPWQWPYHDWVYHSAPAGGINSSVADLAQWLRFYLQGGTFRGHSIVSASNLYYLHVPKINAPSDIEGETRQYCLGWLRSTNKSGPIIWHNGGTSGMKSIIALLPDAQVGIVILSNLFNTLLPEALIRVFADLWRNSHPRNWIQELFNQQSASIETLKQPPGPLNPPRPWLNYTGTYYNKLYGPITVVYSRGSLALIIGPKRIRLPLKSWGGDTFVTYWPGVLTNGTGVQFLANKYNRIDRVEIQGMNDDVDGCFRKKEGNI